MDYTSLSQLTADLNLLFDNCVEYWKSRSSEGKVYIEVARYLKQMVNSIIRDVSRSLSESASAGFLYLQKRREKPRASPPDRHKIEPKPVIPQEQPISEPPKVERAPASPPSLPVAPRPVTHETSSNQ